MPKISMLGRSCRAIALALIVFAFGAAQALADSARDGKHGVFSLRPSVEIAAARVRLADVLVDAPAGARDIVIAQAPPPGQSMTLPATVVVEAAARAGIAVAEGGAQVVRLYRPGRVVARSELEARIAALVQQRLGEERLQVVLAGMHEIVLPATAGAGDLKLALTSIDERSRRVLLRASWPDGFGGKAAADLAARYEPLAAVPVLAHALARGDVVRAEDLTTIWMPASRLSRGLLLDREAMLGMEATRNLPPKAPLRRGDLRRPLLVEKGGLVTMRLEAGALIVTAQGRAMEDGARGEIVRVVNVASRRIVEGRVVGAGLVAVSPRTVRLGAANAAGGLALR